MKRAVFLLPDLFSERMCGFRVMSIYPAQYMGQYALPHDAPLPEADVVIAGKPTTEDYLQTIIRLSAEGRKVWSWIGDAFHPASMQHDRYRRLIAVSDGVVVQTRRMAEYVRKVYKCKKTIRYIPEMSEYPEAQARFAPKNKMVVAWAGHSSNFDTLPILVEALRGRDASLLVVANDQPPPEIFSGCMAKFAPWSRSAQRKVYEVADIVAVPSWPGDEDKDVKGQSRVAEPLRAGRCVVASPLPSYAPYAPYAYVGDIAQGIDAALSDPVGTIAKIRAGQEFVNSRHGAAAVCHLWQQLIEDA